MPEAVMVSARAQNGMVDSTVAPRAASVAAGRQLRLIDLLVVVMVTAGGVMVLFAGLVLLARQEAAFYRRNREAVLLLSGLGLYAVFGAGVLFALRRFPHPARFLSLRRPSPTAVILATFGLVPWFSAVAVVARLSSELFNHGRPLPSNARQLFVQTPHGAGLLLLALLVTAVAAPICEEVFFRGMVYRFLRARAPLWAAAPLSALLFALAHVSPVSTPAVLPVFLFMGIALALIYEWTGSLANSILLHSLNNAVLTMLVFLVGAR